MTQTQTDTEAAGDRPAPAAGEQADAERLARLESENRSLQSQLDEMLAAEKDRATREARLKTAEQSNAELQSQYTDAVLNNALRAAAEVLDLPAETVLEHYKHEFKAAANEKGKIRIAPNPTEFLAAKLKAADPLLRSARANYQTRRADAAAMDRPSTDPASLLEVLDRSPTRKAEYIRKHGASAYVRLARRAGQARRAGR